MAFLSKEDLEFLQELKNEMNSQNTFGQADPRYWTIRQNEKIYHIESGEADGVSISDIDNIETVFEGSVTRFCEWLDKFEFLEASQDCSGHIEVKFLADDEITNETFCFDEEGLSEILEYIGDRKNTGYAYTFYMNTKEIKSSTMFITLKDCKDHLASNYYHYDESAHPYAMTAWRSPSVERLYEIIKKTDFIPFNEEIEELNKAIAHCEEVVNSSDCSEECSLEHKQLASWLTELKALKGGS